MKAKTIFIAILAIGAVFVVVPLFAKRSDPEAESDDLISQGGLTCVNVPGHLSKWTETGWYGNGGSYVKQKYGSRYADFDVINENQVSDYAAGFMKAIGLKYNKTNVRRFESQLLTYLKSADKAPHWDESIGRLVC